MIIEQSTDSLSRHARIDLRAAAEPDGNGDIQSKLVLGSSGVSASVRVERSAIRGTENKIHRRSLTTIAAAREITP